MYILSNAKFLKQQRDQNTNKLRKTKTVHLGKWILPYMVTCYHISSKKLLWKMYGHLVRLRKKL